MSSTQGINQKSKPKKFLNPSSYNHVNEVIQGLLYERPNTLKKLANHNVVLQHPLPNRKVHLLSGGGSGHEPAHAGYIGKGMLSGAILGNVFASPSVSQILAAIRAVTRVNDDSSECDGGCLLIVKNYTGDRLNFGMACELANAEGRKTAMVVVDDDCALPRKKGVTGSRGLAGTVFVHKIAGAAAEQGLSLSKVQEVAQTVIGKIGSLGVSFESVTLPDADCVNDRLKGEVMEVGLGIHGEAGIRQSEFLPVQDIAKLMVQTIVDFGFDCTDASSANTTTTSGEQIYSSSLGYLKAGDKIVIMVNNLGGTSNFEMHILVETIVKMLESEPYQCKVVAVYNGSFMTSFNMHGASLSILSLDNDGVLENYLKEQALAPAWDNSVEYYDHNNEEKIRPSLIEVPEVIVDTAAEQTALSTNYAKVVTINIPNFSKRAYNAILAACDAIITNEPQLTRFDTIVGDGDCGQTFARGATEIKNKLQNGTLLGDDDDTLPHALFWNIANAISESMGGSSGILLELMFRKISTFLRSLTHDDNNDEGTKVITKQHLCQAFIKGTESISFYGGAKVGARTMLDALVPAAVEAATAIKCSDDDSSNNLLKDMSDASKKGALSTAFMKEALAGRSNYLSEQQIVGTPDPGAMAIAVILEAIASSF